MPARTPAERRAALFARLAARAELRKLEAQEARAERRLETAKTDRARERAERALQDLQQREKAVRSELRQRPAAAASGPAPTGAPLRPRRAPEPAAPETLRLRPAGTAGEADIYELGGRQTRAELRQVVNRLREDYAAGVQQWKGWWEVAEKGTPSDNWIGVVSWVQNGQVVYRYTPKTYSEKSARMNAEKLGGEYLSAGAAGSGVVIAIVPLVPGPGHS